MKRPKKFIYHSLVFILCGTLFVNSIATSASIEEASTQKSNNEVWKTQESIASENTTGDLSLEQLASKILSDEEIPELLSIESVKQNNHVNRLYNQETDLSSVIFQNRDGSKTLYSFGAPVKYVDDDGVIRDKSNSLTEPGEKPEVAYVNEENDIKTYFPKNLNSSQGIVLEAKDIRIEMVPIAGIGTIETINGEIPEIANIDDTNKIISEQKYSSSESVLNLQIDANPSTALKSNTLNLAGRTADTVVFDQVFGKGTKIIYTPDFNGFKEDIVLDYYTGHNEFTFLIKTGGLTLLKENEVISFYDSLTGEKMGNLGELLIYDSSNNFDKTEYEHHYKVNESIPNEEYFVTIVVDQEFLTSQNTIYPVVVDPVLVIDNSLTGANYIQDASLWSKQPNTVYNTASMRLGYDTSTTGSYRIVMKSNNLISNMSVIPASNNITSAYLSVNHVDNYLGDTMLVDAHPVTKAWEETTVTSGTLWSNYGSSTYSNNYYNGGPNGWRNYYITSTVKSWKAGTSSNNGIMLKARYESSPRQWIAIAASEYSTTSARPYIVINYNSVTYTTLTLGQSVNGYIEQGGVYWYKFTPLETATFTFETTGLTDTYGELYQGTTLIEPPDDDGGEGLNFKITQSLSSGIEYRLKVRGYSVSTTGSYSLSLSFGPVIIIPTGPTADIVNGSYYFLKCNSGKYMDVYNDLTDIDSPLGQWSFHGEANQRFRLQYQSNGEYTIQIRRSTSRYVAVNSSGNVVLSSSSTATTSRWYIVKSGSIYKIVNKYDVTKYLGTSSTGNVYFDLQRNPTYSSWSLEAGGSYRDIIGNPYPNCFGYAVFNPGNLGIYSSILSAQTINHKANIEAALEQYVTFRYLGTNYTAAINSDEYRIAIRFPNGVPLDSWRFHVIYQLSNGQWAGKNDTYPSQGPWSGNPSITSIMWGGDTLFPESSGTIYYAVKLN